MPQTETLTEMQFVVHFQEPTNWTMLDMASLAETFRVEFPIPQETVAMPPINTAAFFLPQLGIMEAPKLPRLILRSGSSPFAIQLQLDRFSFSWTRNSPLEGIVEYPGYDQLKTECLERMNTLSEWQFARLGAEPRLRLIEINYWNMTPLKKSNDENRRLSEVFKFVSPEASRPINQFSASWTELFELRPESPLVRVQTGVGQSIANPSSEAQNVIFFNFAGIGPINCAVTDQTAFSAMADALHQRIVDVYASSIISSL